MKRRLRVDLVVVVLVLAAIGTGAGGAYSAFRATATNTGNRHSSGTVNLSDNDAGAAVVSLVDAQPGSSDSGCIAVSYSGTLPATVRIYGTTGGTGLDQYVDLRITRGTYSSQTSFDSCANFVADTADYVGAGPGVIYSGTLRDFADDYATALADPPAGPAESWTNGETHVYKVRVTLQNQAAAAGLTATQTFVWEARNQ